MFCCAAITLAAATTPTTSSSSTSSSSTITLNLPTIYIQNQAAADGMLKRFTVSYTYSKSETVYSKQTITSTNLPTKTTTSIASSMQIDEAAEKTPEFNGVKSIVIDTEELQVNSHLLGLDPINPIAINKNSDNKWYLVTEAEQATTSTKPPTDSVTPVSGNTTPTSSSIQTDKSAAKTSGA